MSLVVRVNSYMKHVHHIVKVQIAAATMYLVVSMKVAHKYVGDFDSRWGEPWKFMLVKFMS